MHEPVDDRRADRRERLGPRSNFWLICPIMIGALLGLTIDRASAATQVSGGQNDLRIKVHDASIKEVFDAMSGKFHLTYKLPNNIGVDRDLTGVYSGTISQVLSRILDGNDYVVEQSNQGFNVVVFRRSGTQPSAGQPVAVMKRSTPPTEAAKVVARRPPILPSFNASPPPLSTYVSANQSGDRSGR